MLGMAGHRSAHFGACLQKGKGTVDFAASLRKGAQRWFHPPRNTALMWPSQSEGCGKHTRMFNACDGVSLQHLAPVQSRTTVVQAADTGRFNRTWQMLMLHGSSYGVSVGCVTVPYAGCTGRQFGWMTNPAAEFCENVILQTRPDLAAWHSAVVSDRQQRLQDQLATYVADVQPQLPMRPRNQRPMLRTSVPWNHHHTCHPDHCFCSPPYRTLIALPFVSPHVVPHPSATVYLDPIQLQWFEQNVGIVAAVPPLPDVADETHLATAVEQPESALCSGYEKGVNIANHIFFACVCDGMCRARKFGKQTSIAFAAYVNRCKDLNIPTQHAMGALFPHHFTMLDSAGSPVGSIPAELWAGDESQRAGYAALHLQIRAMMCRLGSSTAYDPTFHAMLFSLLISNVTGSYNARHILKYGLENAFPAGVSRQAYKNWYGNEMLDHSKINDSTCKERFLFLQALIKRFTGFCWFLTVTLNMAKTAGFETMTAQLQQDFQNWLAHCVMFVRRWHRTVHALIDWQMTGIEQPLGPLTHKFVRSEFQPNRGGLQHYHCLLATLLDIMSPDPAIRMQVLQRLRACVTRNLPFALCALGLPEEQICEVMLMASAVLRHHHDKDCRSKVNPHSGLTCCKDGCPWRATPHPEGDCIYI